MNESASNAGERRRRGVRASPARLQQALVESGLKSQTAVAVRIADQEGLETPPRGLVNRVFRGERVDPVSVERVARALGVDAWTLYLRSDEADGQAAGAPVTQAPTAPGNSLVAAIAIVVAVFAVIAFLRLDSPLPGGDASDPPLPRSLQPTVAIVGIAGPRSEEIVAGLATELDRRWRVVPASDQEASPQQVLDDTAIDLAVSGRITRSGRWLGITFDLHESGSMQTGWRGYMRDSATASTIAAKMSAAADGLHAARSPSPANQRALDLLLEGRAHLDKVRSELNVKRALVALESAIRADPEYVDAYAAHCEALVTEHVRTGDSATLGDAAGQCARAVDIDASHVEARRVIAYLLRKQGELEASRDLFDAVLADQPDNADAWMGLANVHRTLYATNADQDSLELSLAAIDRATELAPDFWKTHFTQALTLYTAGRLDDAIEAAEAAVALDANILALSNLGSFQYCRGDFDDARQAYEGVRAIDPTSFVGSAQLAIVLYHLRDFDASVDLLGEAIARQEEAGRAADHRLWGNYADALRQAGRAEAADAYRRAIRLAERADGDGDRNPVHGAYLAFYKEVLTSLPGQRNSVARASAAELESLQLTRDSMALLYLSAVHGMRGDRAQAESLKEQGSVGCPGLALSPDFELAGTTSMSVEASNE